MSSCQGPGNGTAGREAGTVTPAPRRSPHQPTAPARSGALIIVPGQVTVRPADGTAEVQELRS
jgi:hypothetical protein